MKLDIDKNIFIIIESGKKEDFWCREDVLSVKQEQKTFNIEENHKNFEDFHRKKRRKTKKVPSKNRQKKTTYDAFCSGLGCAERCKEKWLLLLLWRFWILKVEKIFEMSCNFFLNLEWTICKLRIIVENHDWRETETRICERNLRVNLKVLDIDVDYNYAECCDEIEFHVENREKQTYTLMTTSSNNAATGVKISPSQKTGLE